MYCWFLNIRTSNLFSIAIHSTFSFFFFKLKNEHNYKEESHKQSEYFKYLYEPSV